MRAHVLFDWLMVMSLERTGMGWFGSGEAGVFGNLLALRVSEPSGLRVISRRLYRSLTMMGLKEGAAVCI